MTDETADHPLTIEPGLLVCIVCGRADPRIDGDTLRCIGCGERFPVRHGIPILLSAEDRDTSVASARRIDAPPPPAPAELSPALFEPRPLGLAGSSRLLVESARQVVRYAYARVRRKRGTGSGQRTQASVKAEYEMPSVDYYQALARWRPMLQGGRLRLTSMGAYRKVLAEVVVDAAARVGARRVLEVGFGDGVNLWMMNRLHPELDLELYGFDYSFHRVALASRHLRPDDCRGFFNGDAKRIALRDRSFDLAYTCHCLEQLPYDTRRVIDEIARVARNVLLIEPFLEVQNAFGRLHNYHRDHATDIEDDARAAGLEMLEFWAIGAGTPFNQSGALLARSPAVAGA